jgi:DNA-binding CsgD family transcriptional regulator
VTVVPQSVRPIGHAVDAFAAVTELLRQAETQVCAMMPVSPCSVAEYLAAPPALAAAAARGVAVRLLQTPWAGPSSAEAGGSSATAPSLDADADRRVLDEVRHPLLVVDRRAALLSPGGLTHDGLLLGEPLVAATLAALFEQLWREADPVATHPGGGREQAVLRLLRTGASDAAAARLIGVSVRTYHRDVASLMGRLGAATRFQAGALAMERGWFQGRPGPG